MSNIEAAGAALQAELDHANAGRAHYLAQVASLEQALAQLSKIGGDKSKKELAPEAKPGRKPRAASKTVRPAKARNGAKASKPGKAVARGRGKTKSRSVDLPSTGGDFWIGLVTEASQFGPDILAAAVAKLGLDPAGKQRKALANRMGAVLAALVKSGKITDSGKGRERRFFKT